MAPKDYDPRLDPMLRHCGWSDCMEVPTSLYPCGPRCAAHSPAALNGREEPGRTASSYIERQLEQSIARHPAGRKRGA